MSEAGGSSINRQPATEDEREWYPVPELGHAYYPPKKCVGCNVLARRAIGEAMGLPIVEVELPKDISDLSGGLQIYELVGNTQEETVDIAYEMALRVEKAVDGSCDYIEEQACWRLIKE